MKRLVTFFSFLIILYSIYYDLNIGTLKSDHKDVIETKEVTTVNTGIPFVTIKVSADDTVLSIVEDINKENKIESIEQIIKDFEELNKGAKAELLQIGEVYRFPVYSN